MSFLQSVMLYAALILDGAVASSLTRLSQFVSELVGKIVSPNYQTLS